MKIEAPSGPEDGERMLFCAHADVDEDHIDISANACVHQPFHWYYVGPDNIVTVEPGGHSDTDDKVRRVRRPKHDDV